MYVSVFNCFWSTLVEMSNDQIHKHLFQHPNCSVSFHYCSYILLCLINELSDKSHINTEKNMAWTVCDNWCFRHLDCLWNRSVQDEGVTACPRCFWLKLTSYKLPITKVDRISENMDIIPHLWENLILPGWNLFPTHSLCQISVSNCHQNPSLSWCLASYPVSSAWAVPWAQFCLSRSWTGRLRHRCFHREHFPWWSAGSPKGSSPRCWGRWAHSPPPPGWSRRENGSSLVCCGWTRSVSRSPI